jgi:hypothetical protein
MTLVFLSRYQEACNLSCSPRWSPSQGPSSQMGNSMDGPGPSPRASGSPVCLSWTAPRRIHYQASGRITAGLVLSVHNGGHATNMVGVVLQDLQTPSSTTMVRASTKW